MSASEDDSGFRLWQSDWSEDLCAVLQHSLMPESQFISFCGDLGLGVRGCVTGDPSLYLERGWLESDGVNLVGAPTFHPFRLYPAFSVGKLFRQSVLLRSDTSIDAAKKFVETIVPSLAPPETIGEAARAWNRVADVAILLEPLYWPTIVGHYSGADDQFDDRIARHHEVAMAIVSALDEPSWREIHRGLLLNAHGLDKNDGLYLLLRVGSWDERRRLRGAVAGSMWLRHMAEVIRRGFEEAHGVQWPEEDDVSGGWRAGMRSSTFGSDRPLDEVDACRPRLAWRFGLTTGSSVRWYLEGDTEYWAVRSALPDASLAGIELYNLMGGLGLGKSSTPLKLDKMLAEDRAFERYSLISIDDDVKAARTQLAKHAAQSDIVGQVFLHSPDFEFANFSASELAQVAVELDESLQATPDSVRQQDWIGLRNCSEFSERFREHYGHIPRRFKGRLWGEALAGLALASPQLESGEPRPFVNELWIALRCRTAHYRYEREHFSIDPVTLMSHERTKAD